MPKIPAFGGMLPTVDDTLLPEGQGALAENTWLYSGSLAGINQPSLIKALTAGTNKVFRLPQGFLDGEHLTDSIFVEFANLDTDIVRTQVIGDTFERYYWASPTDVPRYNTRARMEAGNSGGNAPFKLGIPAPAIATLSITGGASSVNRTTAYVYTWVTAYGEEGPISPPVTGTGKIDATWKLTLVPPAAGDVGTDRNITKARIYRTVTAATGVTSYYFVAEVNSGIIEAGDTHTNTTIDGLADTTRISAGFAVAGSGVQANTTVVSVDNATTVTISLATTSTLNDTPITFSPIYSDTALDATVAANNQVESTNWTAPPTDLQGWVAMPNGILAGFRENEIWFSEPYRFHAWPSGYTLSVDFPIVGMGVIGQTLVVCTNSYPFAITGVHPASMTQAKIMNLEPCSSRGSILSAPEGVYYASENGLILVANGKATNVSSRFVSKDKWQTFLAAATLSTLRAARLGTAYYAYGTARPGVFQDDAFQLDMVAEEDFTGALNGILLDPSSERVAFNVLTSATPFTSLFNDPWSGELLQIKQDNLYHLDIAKPNPAYEKFIWRSKLYQAPLRKNFGAMRIYFDTEGLTLPALNPVRNTSSPQTLAADQWGLVRVFCDGDLVTTRELRTSGELMRIPGGFKGDYWQFEFEARVKIKSFQVAPTAKELAKL